MQESRVYLRKTATNQLVEASLLDEVIDKHLTMWSGSWSAAMQAVWSKYSSEAKKLHGAKALIGNLPRFSDTGQGSDKGGRQVGR